MTACYVTSATSRRPAMTDHLARLCFDGPGSSGSYTTHAFSLRLSGVRQPLDHVVYLHEVHHAALNDVTAWGSALHVYARLPGDAGQQFIPLLDACRTTHESLATFASVQIASARHGALDGVLAAYPSYVPLYEAAVHLLSPVQGPNRRQLMANALARLCMQTPVLEEIAAVGLGTFRLAAIRDIDRPDARWNWFARQGPALAGVAAAAADRALVTNFDRATLDSDESGGDLYTSTDRSHDEAWDYWEAAAYERLRAALSAGGARTLSFNGHQDGSAALLALVAAEHGDIGLRAAMSGEQRHNDAALASSVLQQVRHDLSGGEPYCAVLLPPAGIAQVAELAGGDGDAMIVDARPAERLAALYRWPGEALPERLRVPGGPVVAVRVLTDHREPGSVIGHAVLETPDDLTALSGFWNGRGPLAVCVSASCLADRGWAKRWLPAFTSAGPVFVLVDIEPDRFVPAWARDGRNVTVVGLDVSDTAARRTALMFTADAGTIWWLVVADDVTVRLMAEYLRGQLGSLLSSDAQSLRAVRDAMTALVSHLLATESFTSFDALGGGHDNR
ncbi:MAG TPA: hypothetical protein VGI74_09815 [Streptosporangiaceae bacterium]